MLLTTPPSWPRRPRFSPEGVSRLRVVWIAVALILGTLVFAWAVQAVVVLNAQAATPPAAVEAAQLPAWFHSPLTAAQRHSEVTLPAPASSTRSRARCG